MKKSIQHKVLVIAPGRKTRGGITAVVEAYATHRIWQNWGCYWLETHTDRNMLLKLLYFFKAMGIYFFRLPFYQILHIHFSEPASAIRKLFFMVPAWIVGKKIILHFHSFSPGSTLQSRFRSLYQWMFEKADTIIVLSETWRAHVAAISKKQLPITVIYNPALLNNTSAQSREDYVLFAGTLNGRKGYADLVKAFSMIADRHPKWQLILAGNGETDEAATLSSNLGIRDRVVIPGWVRGTDKERLFSKAAVFCLPSYAEGFPMSVIDAMTYQIPVISTPVGGIMDVFREGEELLFTTPGNVYELAEKLDMMIRHPIMRQRMAMAAGTKLANHFRLDVIAQQLDKLYRRVNRNELKEKN